jgi:hypothetical protein
MGEISKPKKAYLRKLYLAYLIDMSRNNIVSLEEKTAMSRRTIQTSMSGFNDIGIEFEFVQDGSRNRHGYYRITSWGDHKKLWIKNNLKYIIHVLQKGENTPIN